MQWKPTKENLQAIEAKLAAERCVHFIRRNWPDAIVFTESPMNGVAHTNLIELEHALNEYS
jgi:hypothetical protein